MPTPDPSMNANRRESRAHRGFPGGGAAPCIHHLLAPTKYCGFLTHHTSAFLPAATLVLAALLAVGCADAPSNDPAIREAVAAQRLEGARRVAAATLPEGALEVAEAGRVEAGVEASRAAPALSNTFDSVEGLARAVLDGLELSRGDALWALALSSEEFRSVVWPVLPASRPERNTPFDYIWGDLRRKSSDSLSRTLQRHKGAHYELVRVEFASETRSYGSFLVHGDARLVVTSADGTEQTLDLFGSVIERDGRFKIFSWVSD